MQIIEPHLSKQKGTCLFAAALLYSTCRHFFWEICGFENRWAILKMTEQILFLPNRLHREQWQAHSDTKQTRQTTWRHLLPIQRCVALHRAKRVAEAHTFHLGSPQKEFSHHCWARNVPSTTYQLFREFSVASQERNDCEPLYCRKISTQLLFFWVGFCNPSFCSSTWWSCLFFNIKTKQENKMLSLLALAVLTRNNHTP